MISLPPISERELLASIGEHAGAGILDGQLKQVAGLGDKFLQLLARYIQFNEVFGSGVANLAAEIAARTHLFQNTDEPILALRDRSMKIAAHVFAAAIDEFGDRGASRLTHRALAQATFKGCVQFFGASNAQANQLSADTTFQAEIEERVKAGYLLNRQVTDDLDFFRALGFHLGSEILADAEFRTLDFHFEEDWKDLWNFLRRSKVTIDATDHPAYVWIKVHCTVEREHYEEALLAANLALQFYVGDQDPAAVRQAVIQGFQHFADVQIAFMQSLLD